VALALLGLQTLWFGWTVLFIDAHVVSVGLLGLSVVFLVALLRGHPLARQWGFYIAALQIALALPALGILFLTLRYPAGDGATLGTLFGLVLILSGGFLWWGLSGQAVRHFFNLHCAGCGSFRTRPRSFLYNRIGCRSCGRTWRWDELVDPSIFE
jgi:hypothetical protein